MGLSARGPLLFALFILFLYYLPSIIARFKRISFSPLKLLLTGTAIMAAILYFRDKIMQLLTIFYENLILRLSGLFTSFDGSIEGRFERLEFAFTKLIDAPAPFLFGYGIGSYGPMYNGELIADYPHNLFVEAWYEVGIAGLILSLIIFVSPFFLKGNKLAWLLAFFFLLQGMKSYSLVSIWLIFGFFGLLLTSPENLSSSIKQIRLKFKFFPDPES